MSILNNITEAPAMLDRIAMAKERSYPAGPRKVAPQHPGTVVAGILEDCGVSVRAAAAAMGISHNALANILRGDTAINAPMALRMGKYLGNGPELWLNLQQDYDLWHAEAELRGQIKAISTLKSTA